MSEPQYGQPVTVEQEVLQDNQATLMDFASRMFNRPLAALRAQNPFVAIEQFPGVISAKLLAGVAQDINLPEGTKMIRFKGNGDYFVTRNGNAVIPTGPFQNESNGSGVIYRPDDEWIYTGEEIKQLSVISVADSFISVCYLQQQ